MSARWLTVDLARQLEALDAKFRAERRNGPLVVEVHYRGGNPQLARVRDVLMAPVLVEMSISFASSTS